MTRIPEIHVCNKHGRYIIRNINGIEVKEYLNPATAPKHDSQPCSSKRPDLVKDLRRKTLGELLGSLRY